MPNICGTTLASAYSSASPLGNAIVDCPVDRLLSKCLSDLAFRFDPVPSLPAHPRKSLSSRNAECADLLLENILQSSSASSCAGTSAPTCAAMFLLPCWGVAYPAQKSLLERPLTKTLANLPHTAFPCLNVSRKRRALRRNTNSTRAPDQPCLEHCELSGRSFSVAWTQIPRITISACRGSAS